MLKQWTLYSWTITHAASLHRLSPMQCIRSLHLLTYIGVIDHRLETVFRQIPGDIVDLLNGQQCSGDGAGRPQHVAAGKQPDRKDHPPVAATLGCGDEREAREQQQEQYSSSAVEHDPLGLRNVCL